MSLLDLAKPNTALAYAPPSVGGLRALATTPVSPTPADTFQGQYQVAKANADYANSFGGLVKNTVTDLGNKAIDIAKTGINAFTAPIQATGQAGAEVGTALKEGKPVEAIASGLKMGVNTVNSALAPVSAAFSMAEKIPVLKPATDILNLAFMVPTKVGEFAGDKFTDALPVSQQTKEILRPALKEVGSLVGQIWLGGKVIETLGTKGEIKPEDVTALKEQAKTIPEMPQSTPATQPPEFFNRFSKQESVPSSEAKMVAPVQETSPTQYPKVNNLPEIKPITIKPETKILELKTQIDNLSSVLDESSAKNLLKYVSKTTGRLPEVTGKETMTSLTGNGRIIKNSEFGKRGDKIVTELGNSSFPDVESAQKAVDRYLQSKQKLNALKVELKKAKGETFTDYSPEQINKINTLLTQAQEGVQTIQSTGKPVVSKSGADILKAMVEKDMTEQIGKLPTHNAVDTKLHSDMAVEYGLKNPEELHQIAMGEKLPTGEAAQIHIAALYSAAKRIAMKNGDVQELLSLSKSPVPTYLAQGLKLLDTNDVNDPTKIMRDLRLTREGAMEKTAPAIRKKISADSEAIVKKSLSKRLTWEEWVNKVKCNS